MKIQDERIISQVYRYGYEAFLIVSLILAVVFITKSLILDLSPKEYLDTLIPFIVAACYFYIRCVFGGAFTLPRKTKDRIKFTKRMFIGNIVAAFIWGIIIAVRNSYLYQHGNFNWLSLIILLISMTAFFIVISLCSVIFYGLSNKQANKDLDK